MFMRRLWLIFAQTVTVCLAILFLVATLRPQWLPGGAPEPGPAPGAPAAPRAPSAPAPGAAPFSYADAVARAAPSVVNIYTAKHVDVPLVPLPADPGLERFLRGLPGFTRRESATSLGSGVIVRADGTILTNYHVIEAADAIEVRLRDGRQAAAKLVGADPESDLAVLKIGLPDLPAIAFDPAPSVRVGDVVLAIGNPFGVGQTTTQGIVSAVGRNRLGLNTYEDFIQTDAAINPGNSGGALIDARGELVGINTAIYSETGGSLGIGFAIPAAAAHHILDEILTYGRVRRGWLGLEPQDITPDLAQAFRLKDTRGAIVARVLPGGPAAGAGVRVGDVIRTLDGRAVEDAYDLVNRLASLRAGGTARLGVWRAGRNVTLEVPVGERPTVRRR
ncbi:serine protease DegQ [Castellaniella defragrans]|jgi:serine protease DegQ|uniref:Serine protease DegQ n=3 Tax=Castellaniella defragrans TaxID=75697 RepID=A0A7W9TK83_CASDE|nr:serine protease DegQ [Castellaniella defragrans]